MFEGQSFGSFCLNLFSHEFQSVLALVDIVLMQMQKFFQEYLHGDLTTKVLTLKCFELYSIYTHM